MTEITLKLDDPHSTINSLREGASDLSPFGARQVYEVVRQIREQLPTPAVEEPAEFGSVVRARYPGNDTDFFLWQKAPDRRGLHYWESELGAVEVWSELIDVEVQRVGVGDGSIADQKAAYLSGRRDFAGAVQRELTALEAGVLTFPEQRCYKDARAMVARLLGES